MSGPGVFFIYINLGGENFNSSNPITLANGASANNVFIYVPNGGNIDGATLDCNLITTGAIAIGSPDTINGRILTSGTISITNFNNGTATINQGGLLPEPSSFVLMSIPALLMVGFARYRQRKRTVN